MVKNIHSLLLAFVLCHFSGFSQQKNNIRMELYSMKESLSKMTFDIRFFSENCKLPITGVDHLHPVYSLVSATNPGNILYQTSEMFISMDKENCIDGYFSLFTNVSIPLDHFSDKKAGYILKVSFDKGKYTAASEPFSIETFINKPPFALVKNQVMAKTERGLSIQLNVQTYNPENAAFVKVKFYLDGQECMLREIRKNITNATKEVNLDIPYTYLALPPGENSLICEITYNYETKDRYNSIQTVNLFTDVRTFIQPQLHWFVFESSNANINVEGMDGGTFVGRITSKKAGRGMGDACYEIKNQGEVLFTSREAKHSGAIPNQKTRVQVYQHEALNITFWDNDVFDRDYLGEFTIKTFQEQENMSIQELGKILNFDLNYMLIPVDGTNYNSFF